MTEGFHMKHSEELFWQENFFKITSVKYHHINWKNPEPVLLDLSRYYVTPIIVGENGTGKTALFEILVRFSRDYKQLKGEKLEDFKNELIEKGIDYLEIEYYVENFSEGRAPWEKLDKYEMEMQFRLTGVSRFKCTGNEVRCSLSSELKCRNSSDKARNRAYFTKLFEGEEFGETIDDFPARELESTILSYHDDQITYSVEPMRKILEKALSECKLDMSIKYQTDRYFMSISEKDFDEMFELPNDETSVRCPGMQTIELFEARKADSTGDRDYSSLASKNHHDYEKIILSLNDEEFREKFSIQKNLESIIGHRRRLKKMDDTLEDAEEFYDRGEVYYFDSHEFFKDLRHYHEGDTGPEWRDGRFEETFLMGYDELRPIFYCAKNLKNLLELLKEEFFRVPNMAKPYIVSKIWGIPVAECIGLMFTDRLSEHYTPGSYMTDGQKRLFSIAKFCAGIGSSRGRVIGLIDEPEASLHLDWQRKLITELQTLTGRDNQIIIATHSPDIVINHIDRVIELNSNLNA